MSEPVRLTITAEDLASPALQQVKQELDALPLSAAQAAKVFADLGISEETMSAATVGQVQTLSQLTSGLSATTPSAQLLYQQMQALSAGMQPTTQGLQALTANLQQVSQSATTVAPPIKQATLDGDGMTVSFGNLLQTGARLAIGFATVHEALNLVRTAVTSTVGEMYSFEAAMNNNYTLGIKSVEGQHALQDAILTLPPALGSSTEMAKGLYQVLSSGVEPAKSVEFLEVAANLAKAGLGNLDTAVVALTKTMAAYQLPTSEAGRVSEVLFQTMVRGQSNLQQFASTFPIVTANAAALGVSFTDTAAAMATLSLLFRNTDTAGTALNTLFQALRQRGAEFAAVGVDIKQVIADEGLTGAMRALQVVTHGNTEELTKFVPEARAQRAALELMGGQYETLAKFSAEFQGELHGVTDAVELQTRGMLQSYAALGNAAKTYFIEVNAGNGATTLWGQVLKAFTTGLQEHTVGMVEAGQKAAAWRAEQERLRQEQDKTKSATQETQQTVGLLGIAFDTNTKAITSQQIAQQAAAIAQREQTAAQEQTIASTQLLTEEKRTFGEIAARVDKQAALDAAALANAYKVLKGDSTTHLEELAQGAVTAFMKVYDTGKEPPDRLRDLWKVVSKDVIAAYGEIPPNLRGLNAEILGNVEFTTRGIDEAFSKLRIKKQSDNAQEADNEVQYLRNILDSHQATASAEMKAWQESATKIRDAYGALTPELRAMATQITQDAIAEDQKLLSAHQLTYDDMQQRVKTLTDWMKGVWGEVPHDIQAQLERLSKGIGTSLGEVGTASDEAGRKLITNLGAGQQATSTLRTAVAADGALVITNLDELGNTAQKTAVKWTGAMKEIREVSVSAFREVTQIIEGDLATLLSGAGNPDALTQRLTAQQGDLQRRLLATPSADNSALLQATLASTGTLQNALLGQASGAGREGLDQLADQATRTRAQLQNILALPVDDSNKQQKQDWENTVKTMEQQAANLQTTLASSARKTAEDMIKQYGELPSDFKAQLNRMGIDGEALERQLIASAKRTKDGMEQHYKSLEDYWEAQDKKLNPNGPWTTQSFAPGGPVSTTAGDTSTLEGAQKELARLTAAATTTWQTGIAFLGSVIGASGTSIDPKQLQAIHDLAQHVQDLKDHPAPPPSPDAGLQHEIAQLNLVKDQVDLLNLKEQQRTAALREQSTELQRQSTLLSDQVKLSQDQLAAAGLTSGTDKTLLSLQVDKDKLALAQLAAKERGEDTTSLDAQAKQVDAQIAKEQARLKLVADQNALDNVGRTLQQAQLQVEQDRIKIVLDGQRQQIFQEQTTLAILQAQLKISQEMAALHAGGAPTAGRSVAAGIGGGGSGGTDPFGGAGGFLHEGTRGGGLSALVAAGSGLPPSAVLGENSGRVTVTTGAGPGATGRLLPPGTPRPTARSLGVQTGDIHIHVPAGAAADPQMSRIMAQEFVKGITPALNESIRRGDITLVKGGF